MRSGKARAKGSVPSQVAEAIKTAIYARELEPGDPVLEAHLAKQYKVSQTAVREALAKLEHAGFVRRVPKHGTFVTKLSAQELGEHVRIRVMLETLAAVQAARYMREDDFAALEERMRAIQAAAAARNHIALTQADLEFHRFIWGHSGDQTLYRMLLQITAPLFAFKSIRPGGREAQRSHEPIFQAMLARDAEAIREAFRQHLPYSHLLSSETVEAELTLVDS